MWMMGYWVAIVGANVYLWREALGMRRKRDEARRKLEELRARMEADREERRAA